MEMLPLFALLYLTVVSGVTCSRFVTEGHFLELKKVVRFQQTQIDKLEKNNDELMERVLKLERETEREGRNGSLEDMELGYHADSAESDARDSNRTRREFGETVDSSILHTASQVAFHVHIGNGNACFHPQQMVVFDTEVIDVGNGYNTSDGIYEPPISGVYVFSWTAVATYNEFFTAELVVNGQVRGTTMADAQIFGGTGIHPATGVAVLQVNAGDNIYVRRGISRGCRIASIAQALNTFSGWLLF